MEGIPIYSASIRPIQYHARGLYALLQDPVKPRRGGSSTARLAGWTGGGVVGSSPQATDSQGVPSPLGASAG